MSKNNEQMRTRHKKKQQLCIDAKTMRKLGDLAIYDSDAAQRKSLAQTPAQRALLAAKFTAQEPLRQLRQFKQSQAQRSASNVAKFKQMRKEEKARVGLEKFQKEKRQRDIDTKLANKVEAVSQQAQRGSGQFLTQLRQLQKRNAARNVPAEDHPPASPLKENKLLDGRIHITSGRMPMSNNLPMNNRQ